MKLVEKDRMKVYVILTNRESDEIREKGIEESNDIIDTMTRFQRVEVIGCE